jgi:hypothetical protein
MKLKIKLKLSKNEYDFLTDVLCTEIRDRSDAFLNQCLQDSLSQKDASCTYASYALNLLTQIYEAAAVQAFDVGTDTSNDFFFHKKSKKHGSN